MRQPENPPKGSLLQVASVGIAVFLSVVVAAVAVAQANVVVPQLGDIVSFKPGAEVPRMLKIEILAEKVDAQRQAQGRCLLDPAVIAVQGGSLVVEGRIDQSEEPGFVVHWAGARTSNGAQDCGADADLVLSRSDLEGLARTAGGFGIAQKRLSPMLGAASLPVVTN